MADLEKAEAAARVLDFWTAPLTEGLGAWTLDIHHTYDTDR